MIGFRTRSSACIAIGVVLLSGCGKNGPFEYTPVQGKVTFEDGSVIPAAGIALQFEAIDAKPVGEMAPRIGKAQLDAEGAFTAATSYKYGDGLIPGRHKVALLYATDAAGKLLVPQAFTSLATTPLIVETGDGTIDIKVPKP